MPYWNQELGRDERRRHRRIDVTVNEHQVRLLVQCYFFESLHDLRGHRSMATRANLEIYIRMRHAQLFEKHFGHVPVVMLTGVNNELSESGPPLKSGYGRRRFHEVRACAENVDDLHANCSRVWSG
jgi:hypothetical protein